MLQQVWSVLYDARSEPPSGLIFPVAGLAFVALGLIGTRITRIAHVDGGGTRMERGSVGARRMLWFSMCWTIIATAVTVVPHFRLASALRRHRYEVVDGSVSDYVEANVLRKTPEEWTVNGHRYVFYDARSHAGFDVLGVVHAGMRVRIADVAGKIARLEIAR